MPEVSVRAWRFARGPEVRIGAGPSLEWWDLRGAGARFRAGALASAALEVPLGGRIAIAVRGALGVVPASLFRFDELGDRLDLQPMWHRGLGGSVSYRW